MTWLAPGLELAALAVAAVPLQLLLRRRAVPAGAGAAVMAVAIFGLAALPELPGGAPLQPPLALAVLVLWAMLALAFAEAWRRGRDPREAPAPQRFALGTWPAATAVTASLVGAALPGWTPLVIALGGGAALLWLWFLTVAGDAAPSLVHTHGEPLDGLVLIVAVSTQGVALLLEQLSAAPFPALAFALVELGAFFYAGLAALVLRSLVRTRDFRLAEDWRNGNCLLHGAASITGLAAVESGQIPAVVCLALWLYVAAVFVAVETIEALRLWVRVRQYGLRAGIGVYSVSQWARNFTFGMFYAFTAAALARFAAADPSWLMAIQRAVAAAGPYVVLALLVIEAALAAFGRSPHPFPPPQTGEG